MSLDILDGNGDPKVVKTAVSGAGSEHIPFHVIEEISGSSIASIIGALNQISSSVKTGGSVQIVTSSQANPIWITGSTVVDVTVGDLITVTSSQTNPVWITGSTTINNLKDTSHSTSTYTGNVTPISLVGPSSYKAVIDSNGAQLVTSSQSTPLWISSSLSAPVGISGSVTLNNTSYTVYSGATHTGDVTNIALIGSSSYKAEVDVSGSQKVGIFGVTNNRAIVDSAGSLQITGSTTINNIKDTDHSSTNYSGKVTPIGLVGFSGNRQTVDSSGAALITGSSTLNNISYVAYNTSTHTSNLTPMAVVGPSGYRLQVDSSGSSIVTSSYANPVVVTASFSQPLATKITSSNSDFPYIRHVVPTGAIRNVFSTTDSTINFNDGTNLGAFQIAANNINRKGLTITNPTSQRLFIAIATQASSSGAGRNGFDLPNNNYDPNSYSFIIYPSGSFFADSTNVSLFYGGFFISSSATLKAFVTETY